MKQLKIWIVGIVAVWVCGTASADLFHSPRFKSPTGRYEIIFASANEVALPFARSSKNIPAGQSAQYVLLFYAHGSSESVSADWYTDIDPPLPAEQIASSLFWSPDEEFVVVTHGQQAKTAGPSRWLISMKSPIAYGFEAGQMQWVDGSRLIADLKSAQVPGGIQLIDAAKRHGELILSPNRGRGYELAGPMGPPQPGPLVIVREYLNHWGDEKEKTAWEAFEPACFQLNVATFKKRSVVCPKQSIFP